MDGVDDLLREIREERAPALPQLRVEAVGRRYAELKFGIAKLKAEAPYEGAYRTKLREMELIFDKDGKVDEKLAWEGICCKMAEVVEVYIAWIKHTEELGDEKERMRVAKICEKLVRSVETARLLRVKALFDNPWFEWPGISGVKTKFRETVAKRMMADVPVLEKEPPREEEGVAFMTKFMKAHLTEHGQQKFEQLHRDLCDVAVRLRDKYRKTLAGLEGYGAMVVELKELDAEIKKQAAVETRMGSGIYRTHAPPEVKQKVETALKELRERIGTMDTQKIGAYLDRLELLCRRLSAYYTRREAVAAGIRKAAEGVEDRTLDSRTGGYVVLRYADIEKKLEKVRGGFEKTQEYSAGNDELLAELDGQLEKLKEELTEKRRMHDWYESTILALQLDAKGVATDITRLGIECRNEKITKEAHRLAEEFVDLRGSRERFINTPVDEMRPLIERLERYRERITNYQLVLNQRRQAAALLRERKVEHPVGLNVQRLIDEDFFRWYEDLQKVEEVPARNVERAQAQNAEKVQAYLNRLKLIKKVIKVSEPEEILPRMEKIVGGKEKEVASELIRIEEPLPKAERREDTLKKALGIREEDVVRFVRRYEYLRGILSDAHIKNLYAKGDCGSLQLEGHMHLKCRILTFLDLGFPETVIKGWADGRVDGIHLEKRHEKFRQMTELYCLLKRNGALANLLHIRLDDSAS